MAKPSSLRNLGPKSDAMLAEIGIETVDQLRALGAVEVYSRLKFALGDRVSLNALWAIHAGLQDQHWQRISPEDKARLIAETAQKTQD